MKLCRPQPSRSAFTPQTGVTLVEVLVAVVILSIGLLGLASLQVLALQNGSQSYQRSQATSLAYEISDRMRTNRIQANSGSYALDPATPPAAPATDCSTTSCSAAQFAAYDLYNWFTRVRSILRSGTARISCSATPCGAGIMQTVTVIWDEQANGATGTDCGATDLTCFSVSFAP